MRYVRGEKSSDRFFRDPSVFEALDRAALPAILQERQPDAPIRVWVPACSTGEEVYSIAIILVEHLQKSCLNYAINLFGTDISEECIDIARTGSYSPSIVSVVSPEPLERSFVTIDSGYQNCRSIREMCVFAVHNLATDPPFSRMDLISCRNLLIYLAPALQQRIFATLFHALQAWGCLLRACRKRRGSSRTAAFPALFPRSRILASREFSEAEDREMIPSCPHRRRCHLRADVFAAPPSIAAVTSGNSLSDSRTLAQGTGLRYHRSF